MQSLQKLIRLFLLILPIAIFGQDATVSLGHVEVDGYTNDIIVPVTLDNPNHDIGGIQFDVISIPAMVELSGVVTAGAALSFSSDYTVLGDGSARVIFYAVIDSIEAGGDSLVLNLHFDGTEVPSAMLDLDIYNLTVSDKNGNVLSSSGINGSITVGNVIYLSATSDTGDVEETVSINIELENSGVVSGMQFDIYDSPNYVDIIDLTAVGRAEGFTVDINELENGYTRVILFDSGNNENILTGSGAILEMSIEIDTEAYADQVVFNFENVTVTDDIGGFYWIAGADSGTVTVFPGYIEEPHNLVAEDGLDAQVLLTWDAPYGPIPEEFTEDFEGGVIPDSWVVNTNGNGWYVSENASSNWWSIPGHTYYAVSNDDGYNGQDTPDNDGNDYLIMPVINMSGASTVTLNFASYFTGEYSQTAVIAVSTDGGESYTDVVSVEPASQWVMTSVDLSQFGGNQNVLVAFHANDNGAWASGWAVDDIIMTFSNVQITRHIHFELTELGSWALTADKTEMMELYPGGIPYNWRVDLQNPLPLNHRPVEIDEYLIYRSTDNINFENISNVDGNLLSYLDEDVVNSTTYYYYVTAVYPSGGESSPTNTVSAIPVEWVELWMDNGTSLSGQMDTLDLYMNNETPIGLFYFEIMDYPDILNSIAILPTDRTEGWSLEIVDIANGNMAITGIAIGDLLAPGNAAVCKAVVYPVADEEVTVNLSYAGASVQDENFIELNWTTESANYEVGIETQYLMLTGGYGISGEEFTSSIIMQNTQPVYGIQVDILADPPFLDGTNYYFNSILDLTNWTLTGDMVGSIYRLIAFDNTLSNPINPGAFHIADITYDVVAGAPDSSLVDISIDDAIISDVNSLPMHVKGISNNVYIGQPPVVYSIENISGELTPSGTGSFEIHMLNTETAYITELYIVDMPNYLTVTNVTGMGRFSSGIIDGSTGENEEGLIYCLGYDFTTGITPGQGAILQVEVQFLDNIQNPAAIIMFESTSTGDMNAGPIFSVNSGFGQFIGTNLEADTKMSMPLEFTLHPNYPNPFNPFTIISYDLANEANVHLNVYDLMGRMIKTIVNETQPAGRYMAMWNATDSFGIPVSAGIYIYRMQADNHVFNRKMILIK